MLTLREAIQRAKINGVCLRYISSFNEYQVYLPHWDKEERILKSYFTDDLEDAILTGIDVVKGGNRVD